MSYKEAISLKLTNNTSIDQPIGILGGQSSTYQNSNNNILVEWDLAGETFSDTTVTLDTTVPVTVDLPSQTIQGVVDALNTTDKAIFTTSGTKVYATSLRDSSVQSADLTVGTSGTYTAVVVGTTADGKVFSQFSPSAILNAYESQVNNTGTTLYIDPNDTVTAGTQFYKDSFGNTLSTATIFATQGLGSNPNILTIHNGIINEVTPRSNLTSNFSRSIGAMPNFNKTTVFTGTTGLTGQFVKQWILSTNGKYVFAINELAIIYRWTFTTAWDFSTFDNTSTTSLNLKGLDGSIGNQKGLAINPIGNKLYFYDNGNGGYRSVSLSTPYDLSTATLDSFSANVSTARQICWNNDGTSLVGIDKTDGINISTYSNPFDLSSYVSNQNEPTMTTYINPARSNASCESLLISPDGTKWYVLFFSVGTPNEFETIECDITDYGDITTLSQNTNNRQFDGISEVLNGFWWNENQTSLFFHNSANGGDNDIYRVDFPAP